MTTVNVNMPYDIADEKFKASDCFYITDEISTTLCMLCQVDSGVYALISLHSGNRYVDSVKCKNHSFTISKLVTLFNLRQGLTLIPVKNVGFTV